MRVHKLSVVCFCLFLVYLLAGCSASITESESSDGLLRAYTQDIGVDASISMYTYKISLPGRGVTTEDLEAIDKLQDWLDSNNTIQILDMIPTTDGAGITEITFVFKASTETHRYNLNLNENNLNLKGYVTSLCVRNTLNNEDLFYYLVLTDSITNAENSEILKE